MNVQFLANLIKNDYNIGPKWELEKMLEAFKRISSINEVIKKAALAIHPEAQIGTKHGHQGRVPLKALELTRDKLVEREQEIAACQSFEELQRIVAESREIGFGVLAIYDTALRIGAKLEIMPAKVYLHHGAAAGANTLRLKVSGTDDIMVGLHTDYLDLQSLPAPLQTLSPYHVENFLCVYENKKIGAKKALQMCL